MERRAAIRPMFLPEAVVLPMAEPAVAQARVRPVVVMVVLVAARAVSGAARERQVQAEAIQAAQVVTAQVLPVAAALTMPEPIKQKHRDPSRATVRY